MRHSSLVLVVAALFFATALVGCSSCSKSGEKKPSGFTAGPQSGEDLAALYLKTIADKDPQMLKQLFMTPEDMVVLHKGRGKQYWQAYFQLSKRAFMENNKDLLGQSLELVSIEPGREIADRGGFTVQRGMKILAKDSQGKEITLEINFVIENNGFYKILGLRYLSEELERHGMLKKMGGLPGKAKFKGVDKVQDVNLKVKKVEKKKPADTAKPAENEEPPAADTANGE